MEEKVGTLAMEFTRKTLRQWWMDKVWGRVDALLAQTIVQDTHQQLLLPGAGQGDNHLHQKKGWKASAFLDKSFTDS